MKKLYPEIDPIEESFIDVDNGHRLHYEICGNNDGIPIVFLHGGPGGGINNNCRRFFDPKKYRVILFSQRGSGKSTPAASIENNTTDKLVEDMEKLREHLNVEKWIVFGGSWGSTLALVYAIRYPQRVARLILRGIFLGRKKEIEWLYCKGASEMFPEAHEKFLKPLNTKERDDIIPSYYKKLTSKKNEIKLPAAKAWAIWEGSISKLLPGENVEKEYGDAVFALSFARIECHYFVNNCFLPQNYILNLADKIKDIPTLIVQGRYDVVCPPTSAWELHKSFLNQNL